MDGRAIGAVSGLLHAWCGGFGFGSVLLRGGTSPRASPSSVEAAGLVMAALLVGTHSGDKSETVTSAPFPKQVMPR